MAPFDIAHLSPRERIGLAEELWDSLAEEEIELTLEQAAELERRRDVLAREGPKWRPWRDVLVDVDKRGGCRRACCLCRALQMSFSRPPAGMATAAAISA